MERADNSDITTLGVHFTEYHVIYNIKQLLSDKVSRQFYENETKHQQFQ